MRHIRFDSPEDLGHGHLRTIIRSAVELAGAALREAQAEK
jgi:hypothetical protein